MFEMEPTSSALLGEFVRRTISSLLAKCERQTATDPEDLKRLRSLLLRSSTILEEAERRHVASRAMLQQLMALRDKTFKGFYVLDAVRCRSLPRGGDGRKDDGGEVVEKEEVNRHSFTLSRFNTAKRVRFSSNCSETAGAASPTEFMQMVHSLEVMINDMKEFVVFLMG
ncbi:hypothetical protein BAE44_0022632 [Dichanthelium oligosanthes]|uniref:Rx N-terminal domain-containing protein n=1 Tax=Dichanthelium oligosanthes TaxID=888268 RepID=A0A1E5UU07_9POAL|nr:hypothetical protein BAE44_0022632 [Dichanthelium oligosanthes]